MATSTADISTAAEAIRMKQKHPDSPEPN